ncbi:MAG: sugar phosphate nucleotidyltransferase [Desulfobia sp.]
MILAAGLGTRLRPYSLIRPKPLFPVLDQPLLLRIISHVKQYGADKILVNCHHLGKQVVSALTGQEDVRIQEEPEILGTGGALRKALSFLDDRPILVVNGDIYHTIDLAWAYEEHLASGADATLVLQHYPRFNNVTLYPDGRISGIRNKLRDEPEMAFTGIQVINPDLLSYLPEGNYADILDCYQHWLDKGAYLRGLLSRGHFWTDLGTPDDYLGLHDRLLQVVCLNRNIRLFRGKEVSLSPDVTLRDWVVIGSGAQIRGGSHLERVVIWDGAVVDEKSVMKDEIVTGEVTEPTEDR